VVDGSKDYRDLSVIATYSGTGLQGQTRTADIYMLSELDGEAAFTDVSTAFIRSAANEHFLINIRMPDTLPAGAKELGYIPGGIYQQCKAIYGTADAPRCFHELLTSQLKENGWVEIANSMFVKYDKQNGTKPTAILTSHVDDLMARGKGAAKLLTNGVGDKLGIDKVTPVEHGKPITYVGNDIVITGKEMTLSKKAYADSITVDLTEQEKRKLLSAYDFKLVNNTNRSVDMSVQKQQQNVVGQLGWLAQLDYRLACPFALVSSTNHAPNEETFKLAKRTLHYASLIHEPQKFKAVKRPVILGWCDANFNTCQADSRLGWLIQIVDESDVFVNGTFDPLQAPHHNYVHWRTTKPGRAVGSSSVAELLALRELVKEVPMVSSIVSALWNVKAPEFYMSDNKAVIDWCHSRYVKSDYQWQPVLRQVLDDLGAPERGASEVYWVPTHEQRADILTKFVPAYKK
jgi:hypothetical protein